MAAPLVADPGSFTLSGQATAPRLIAAAAVFALAFQPTTIGRDYTVDLGSLSLRLDRLQATISIIDAQGRPSAEFQTKWQRHCEAIETAFGRLKDAVVAIQTAYNAAAQAQNAAAVATTAVAEVQEVAATATQLVEDLQSGNLNLPSITIGGKKFANVNDELEVV